MVSSLLIGFILLIGLAQTQYPIVNLAGKYKLQITGYTAYFSDDQISFTGCNTITIPYTELTGGRIQFGQPISTYRYCEQDADDVYLSAILTSSRYEVLPAPSRIVFYDSSFKTQITFLNLFNEQPYPFNLDGGYEMQFPIAFVYMQFNSSQMTIEGCYQSYFKYTAYSNGNITFRLVGSQLFAQCQNGNYDQAYVSRIISSTNYRSEDGVLKFLKGEDVHGQAQKVSNFEGMRKGKLPGLYFDVQYKLSQNYYQGGTMYLQGCNNHHVQFLSENPLQFGPVISTRRSCDFDPDSYYLNALLSCDFVIHSPLSIYPPPPSVFYRNNRPVLIFSQHENLINFGENHIEITSNYFNFIGCLTMSLAYIVDYEQRTIYFAAPGSVVSNCAEDISQLIIDSFLRAEHFVDDADQLRLLDGDNNILYRLSHL